MNLRIEISLTTDQLILIMTLARRTGFAVFAGYSSSRNEDIWIHFFNCLDPRTPRLLESYPVITRRLRVPLGFPPGSSRVGERISTGEHDIPPEKGE